LEDKKEMLSTTGISLGKYIFFNSLIVFKSFYMKSKAKQKELLICCIFFQYNRINYYLHVFSKA
jgi:hypothetical protein